MRPYNQLHQTYLIADLPDACTPVASGQRPHTLSPTALGDKSTLFMAGVDWWPWTHLHLQANYISNKVFQAMVSVKF